MSRLAVAIAAACAAFAASAADAPDTAQLDAIEVRADRLDAAALERAKTPGAVTIVDGESFHERQVNNTSDALRYVPGLWTDSAYGGDAVFLSSRGSNLDATDYDTNGIKLLQDGLPVTTADGNNHNRFLDPLAARQAVIARGANALTYGASNLGGAIDFLTPTARNSSTRQVFVNAGSFGHINGRATLGGVADDFDGLVTLDAKARDGYRDHSRQTRESLFANAGWQLGDDVEVRVFATHVNSDEELAGALTRAQAEADPNQANPSALTGNFQLNVTTNRFASKAMWDIDASSRLEVGLSYEDQSLYHPIVDKILVDFDGSGPNPPVEVFSLLKNTDQKNLGGMLRYNVRAGDHDLLAGLNLGDTREDGGNYRNDGGRRNGLTGIIDNDSDSAELFLLDRWTVAPDWTLVYGAQGVLAGRDVSTTDVASGNERNPAEDYSAINPRIGVLHGLGAGSELFASVSRLFEAPTTFEIEDDVRGNGDALDPMRGVVYEVGVRGASSAAIDTARWHWDVSVYYAQIDDEILSVDDPAAPGTSLSTNVDRTIHAGVEALVGGSIPIGTTGVHRIDPLVSATFNQFSFDNDALYADNDLPAAPDYVIRSELMYRHAGGFYIGPTLDLVGERYADFANSYRVDSYTLLGLRAGFSAERWDVYGELRNLLDEDYIATMSVRNRAFESDAILQPGAPRAVFVGLRYQF
ncbi:TonB-dependent receptor [Ahniella affigens]|uniref:TonB-dependent receptor n=2 Tax=Ahniella affigens TaxID=2021234 RepID=A0A2P1PQZ7_9GAMM|nr:TonB-dependent receptor [Ahniella affigens]